MNRWIGDGLVHESSRPIEVWEREFARRRFVEHGHDLVSLPDGTLVTTRLVTQTGRPRRRRYQVRPIFAWFDLWVGVFIDRPKRRIYVFPIPCVGLVITRSEVAATPSDQVTP